MSPRTAVVICAVGSFGLLAPLAAQRPVGASLAGRVVDADNRPVDGAVVTILPAGRRVTTDAQGRFAVDDLSPLTYRVTATRAGYVDGEYGQRRPAGPAAPVALGTNQHLADLVVRLWKQASISGTVRDELDGPAAGLEVRAIRRAFIGGRPTMVPAALARTDDRGAFRFGELTPGEYYVVLAFNRSTLTDHVTEHLGVPKTFVPVGGGVLISSTNGAPVRHAPGPNGGLLVYPMTFCPAGVDPATASTVTVASSEERTGVDCRLSPVAAATVSGDVHKPDGSVAEYTVLRLVPEAFADVSPVSTFEAAHTIGLAQDGPESAAAAWSGLDASELTTSDEKGHFSFAGVPLGRYVLRVFRRPDPPATMPGTLLPDGTIAYRGPNPDPNAPQIPVAPAVRAEVMREMAFGKVLRQYQPPNRQAGMVGDNPLVIDRLVNVDRPEVDAPVTLERAPRVTGTIVFEGTNDRPGFYELGIVQEPTDGHGVGQLQFAIDKQTGSFYTFGAPPGRYFVSVESKMPVWSLKSLTAGGKDLIDTPIDLGPDDLTDVVATLADQTLRQGSVEGRVTTDGTTAAVDSVVLLFPADRSKWVDGAPPPRLVRTSETGPNGEYLVSNLRPGDYLVAAISEAAMPNASSAAFFSALSGGAATVHVGQGERRTENLRAGR